MKHSPIRLLALIAVAAASLTTANADTRIENVSATEFQALAAQQNGIILDVRTPEEVAQGKIPGASVLNIYDDDFERKLNLMQKDKPIYVYCRSGGRSSQAARKMVELGFSAVYNLDGGIGAWNKANLPTQIAPAAPAKKAPSLSLDAFRGKLGAREVVLVDFHTQWCAPCKQMEPIVESLRTEVADSADVLKIDVDANPEIAEAYAVQGVPVFALFVDGKETWRHSGIVDADTLRQKIATAKK